MSKSELFTTATIRNALRKEAGLPLLNIREQITKEENAQEWRDFAVICDQHKAVREKIEARIRDELGARGFDCQSYGGKIMLDAKIRSDFNTFLDGIGVKIPITSGTHYGNK